MTGTAWISQAERLIPAGSPGVTDPAWPPCAVWHTTEGANFDAMHRVLTDKRAEPHLLYDPRADRLGQYFALDQSARALKAGDGPVSNNKAGRVVIQVEVCAYAADPFTAYWSPGPAFAAVLAAVRSWGIPDVWPAGRLATHGEDVSRSAAAWQLAGHFGHCNVPDNSHWDPGGIDTAALLAAGGPPPATEDDDMGFLAIQNPAGLVYLLSDQGFCAAIDDGPSWTAISAAGVKLARVDQNTFDKLIGAAQNLAQGKPTPQ